MMNRFQILLSDSTCAATLRTEQDRAAAAGEGALKIRLKREELFAKVSCCNFKHGLIATFRVETLVQVDTHV
jgi:hypothetical protein